ncbi:response regulator transcription factor [Marinovum sp. 2_MG-2023]|uniref:response regulator transcription factor n=1 Tax=unclassified Marinovum TaxID=2647166 RepID=UPI0026E167EB|nr:MULTISPECIES: response regulator transcription factor [unclassified Marinovum]MDO6729238.1 response regulator transcription factor [Marinovum sp. 2_MG-2023]MDO6779135.1 response regulator transcription factor [Marinovum sp. 1_MG-2023]
MRVLIIEDDEVIADAVGIRFRRDGVQLDHLVSCEDLSPSDADADFDVIVLDLGLPGADGLDFLRALRRTGSAVPVLVFTARYAVTARVEALNLGADDYLTKPFDMDELMARCRALARRRGGWTPSFLRHRDLTLDIAANSGRIGDRPLRLKPKVFQLLQYFIENRGRVLTKSMIESQLYGWNGEVESNTIEVFVSQIRREIGSDYIKTIRGVGYLMARDD